MIFLELVPRELDIFYEECSNSLKTYSQLSGINVPDIVRLDNRSYDIVLSLLEKGHQALPHIRALDKSVDNYINIIDKLQNKGLKKVLVVNGDKIEGRKIKGVPSIELIKAIKNNFPNLLVYGALDPYRSSFENEIEYCEKKIEHGCDGFFTQPFFDASLAKQYLKNLENTSVFLGISPVLTEKSKHYWKFVNNVKFNNDFKIDFEYNIKLGKELISLSKEYSQHCYIMPIRASLDTYLTELLN